MKHKTNNDQLLAKPLCVRTDAKTYEALADDAWRRRLSVSEVVRKLILRHLERDL